MDKVAQPNPLLVDTVQTNYASWLLFVCLLALIQETSTKFDTLVIVAGLGWLRSCSSQGHKITLFQKIKGGGLTSSALLVRLHT